MKRTSRRWITVGVLGMSTALGCDAGCVTPVSSDGSGGSDLGSSSGDGGGDPDGGDVCITGGADGGVEFPIDAGISFPDCTGLSGATILQGTLDGKPYDQTCPAGNPRPDFVFSPPSLLISPLLHEGPAERFGSLEFYWREPANKTPRHSVLFPVSVGTLSLQEDTIDRALLPGSAIRIGCSEDLFQFILVMDSGQLVGCAIQ